MNHGITNPLSLVLFGGSAGSMVLFEEILQILERPLSFAAVFVLHRGKASSAVFPRIFKNKTNVFMSEPQHLDPVEPDSIYFAIPDYHLLIGPDKRFYYDSSEKDFFSRPSIDATFISAAFSGIPVKAAMLFSGSSADGAFGLKVLAERGSATYVLDPADAESKRMPEAALQQYSGHKVLSRGHFSNTIKEILHTHST
ncbi:chemotaxis protein CheB [Dyadobacter sp. Leaf189]|uniref:chemotaxis protein CheB n=1 Tax=Dyadobacter sp. Leaf189 TaxID=1736295 RepID=UPI0006F7DA5F|nr:chemotaxis protein CheB [Dyadobacter sp. Leaf189]KQS28171.1 chemotaxis protein CheB [Dyadobacter sp. Leaf189]